MCGEHGSSSKIGERWGWAEEDTPPDWKSIILPPDHVLQHCRLLNTEGQEWSDSQ
jgi:hypothetical protein